MTHMTPSNGVCVGFFLKAVNSAWKNLKSLASEREEKLSGALEIQEFNRCVCLRKGCLLKYRKFVGQEGFGGFSVTL